MTRSGDPLLRPFARLDIQVGPPVDLGALDGASRRLIPITGGTVSGEIEGRVLAGGADWQVVRPAFLEIAARYVLECSDGLIEVNSIGIRSGPAEVLARLARNEIVPSDQYYFRTSVTFRTAAPALAGLNQLLFIAKGERGPAGVGLEVYALT